MEKFKEKFKLYIALIWIAASICSLFVSIVYYQPPESSEKTVYALQDMLDGDRFSREVLSQYTAPVRLNVGNWALVLLCVLAVAAILSALIGIVIMTKQRPVLWPFVMTLIGVIGTAIPAIAVFTAVCLSGSLFRGTITPGFYPIVTPIAMIFCLIIILSERKRIKRAAALVKSSGGLIRPAGDLS